jgi:HAD superfamily hydrolase (TIGR01490 family)
VSATPPRDTRANGLALFDFDGTLTRTDTFVGFIRFAFGSTAVARALLGAHRATWALLRGQGLDRVKLHILRSLFSGRTEAWVAALGADYARRVLPRTMRPAAVERLDWHHRQGHAVVIVSASLRFWLLPFCHRHHASLICTELAARDGVLTGDVQGEHCYGPAKARRVLERFDRASYRRVYAYGDSRGDRELLALADEPYYRTFARDR